MLSECCQLNCYLAFSRVYNHQFWPTLQCWCSYKALLLLCLFCSSLSWPPLLSVYTSWNLLIFSSQCILGTAVMTAACLCPTSCPGRKSAHCLFSSAWHLLLQLPLWVNHQLSHLTLKVQNNLFDSVGLHLSAFVSKQVIEAHRPTVWRQIKLHFQELHCFGLVCTDSDWGGYSLLLPLQEVLKYTDRGQHKCCWL